MSRGETEKYDKNERRKHWNTQYKAEEI